MPLTAEVTFAEPTVTVTMSETAAKNLLALNRSSNGKGRAGKTLRYVASAIKAAGVETPSDWKARLARGTESPLKFRNY